MQDCISTSQIFRKLLVLTRDHNVLSEWSFDQLISQLQVFAPLRRLSATMATVVSLFLLRAWTCRYHSMMLPSHPSCYNIKSRDWYLVTLLKCRVGIHDWSQ